MITDMPKLPEKTELFQFADGCISMVHIGKLVFTIYTQLQGPIWVIIMIKYAGVDIGLSEKGRGLAQ